MEQELTLAAAWPWTALAVALVAAGLLTPLSKGLGPRMGAMDRPSELSLHSRPIPRTGGLAMFIAFWLAVGCALAVSGWPDSPLQVMGLAVGSAIMLTTGLVDDIRKMPPWARLLLQIVAAVAAIGLGLRVGVVPALAALPLTAFYLVGGANAMNLMDGMNGLAAGICALAALAFFALSVIQGNGLGMALSLALLGSSLGFLYHNFRRETDVFMGDSGSLFLGFMLASIAVVLTSKPYDLAWFLAPLLVLGLLILDTFWAITRRLVRRSSVMIGDRSHLYDRLMKEGLSPTRTVLVCYLGEGLLCALALILVETSRL